MPPSLGWTVRNAKQPPPYIEEVPLREVGVAGSDVLASHKLLNSSSAPQVGLGSLSPHSPPRIPDKKLNYAARIAAAELRLKQAQRALPTGIGSKRDATRGRKALESGMSSVKM